MAGLMAVGGTLENQGISGLDRATGLQDQREEAGSKLKAQAVGNAINTAGTALGLAGIVAVKVKKSGILNDIF